MAVINTIVPGVYVQQASSPLLASSTEIRFFNTCYLVGTAASGTATANTITPITSVADFVTKAGSSNSNEPFVKALFDNYPNIQLNFIKGLGSGGSPTLLQNLVAGLAAIKETDPLGIVITPQGYMSLTSDEDRTSLFTAANNVATNLGLVHYADVSDEMDSNSEAVAEADLYLAATRYAALYYGGVMDSTNKIPGSVISAAHTLRGFSEVEPFCPPANKFSVASITSYPADISDADRETLYAKRINTLKRVPGRGLTMWGTKTTGTLGIGDINTLIAAIVVEKSAPLGFDVFQTKRDANEISLEIKTRLTTKMNALFNAGALQANVTITEELAVNLYNQRFVFPAGTTFERGFYVFDPILVDSAIIQDFLYIPVGVYEQVLFRVSRVTV